MASAAPSIGDPDGTCRTDLLWEKKLGLSFTIIAACMSTSMVLMLLGLVARNFIRNVKDPPPGGEWRLIRTHIDAYLLSLFGAEIVQGVGAIMSAKWILEGTSYCSDYCTAQGAIKTIGAAGVAMSTLAIALHTFIVIFFWWIPGPRAVWIYRAVIASIWSYLILFVIVGYFEYHVHNPNDPDVFFSPAPYWCWISGGDAERIMGEYFWLSFAMLLSIFCYTLLFFRLRGNIQVDPRDWKRIHVRLHPDSGFQPTAASREAMAVIWYPISYTVLVLPLIVVRWLTFHPLYVSPMPFVITATVITIFGLSGVASVVLAMLTRRNLLLLGPNRGVVN